MVGFTESFNVSVSTAICASALLNKIRVEGNNWRLSDEEKDETRFRWIRSMVRKVDILERNFLKGEKP
jgi:tRNA (guanosine-2'-O-)-methyltransferase